MSSSPEGTYFVVVFPGDENNVAIIPFEWRKGKTKCWWPPIQGPVRLEKAIRGKEKPTSTWKVHDIRILGEADTYQRAKVLLTRAEVTSDIATEQEDDDDDDGEVSPKRRKIKNRRYISDDDDDDDEYNADEGDCDDRVDSGEDDWESINEHPSLSVMTLSPVHSAGPSQTVTPRHQSQPSVRTSTTDQSPGPSQNHTPRHHLQSVRATTLQYPSPSQRVTPRPQSQPRLQAVSSPSNSIVNATDRQMLTLLAELKQDIKNVQRTVERNSHILKELRQPGALDTELPDDMVLPVTSTDRLKEIDDMVKSDRNIEKRMVLTLAVAGGESIPVAVRRMLSQIMTNTVMLTMNWTGQGGKVAFRDLAVRKVLEKAILKNPSTAQATTDIIQREAVKYLKGSSDRDGGRKARMRIQVAEPGSEEA